MNQDEQRFVAIKRVIDRVLWTAGATEANRKLLAAAISDELASYTAAVEAMRDADVAVRDEYVEELRTIERELTRKLAEQQAVIEAMRSASHKMMMMYWRMKGTNSEFITMIGGGSAESEARTMQKWKEFEVATSIEPSGALNAILAKERERCAKECERADGVHDHLYAAAIRSLK